MGAHSSSVKYSEYYDVCEIKKPPVMSASHDHITTTENSKNSQTLSH